MSNPVENQSPAAAACVTSQKYHAMFPKVSSLSSQTLINGTLSLNKCADYTKTPDWHVGGRKALLVDVRSTPERKVSMISGAISLQEFKKDVLPNLIDADFDADATDFVFYCTIGYRSGMEIQKLLDEYPILFGTDNTEQSETNCWNRGQSKIQLRNLDGVLNFANVLRSESSEDMSGLLIDPSTNQPATKIHVYGPSWKHCLCQKYDPVVFSNIEFALRGLGVLYRSISCPSCLGSCLSRNKSQ
jgi:rhodanese-related sulfurtransferase